MREIDKDRSSPQSKHIQDRMREVVGEGKERMEIEPNDQRFPVFTPDYTPAKQMKARKIPKQKKREYPKK